MTSVNEGGVLVLCYTFAGIFWLTKPGSKVFFFYLHIRTSTRLLNRPLRNK